VDDPRVVLYMPDLKALAALTDKMKGLSDVIEITASSDGKMKFSVGQQMVRREEERA